MHGMVNRALQQFLTVTYGPETWHEIATQARVPADGFEAMLRYDDRLTMACFQAACAVLHTHPNALLEDVGTWLVTDNTLEPLRRLLRFGGSDFLDFLHSLEEISDRGRLAIPDLEMPVIELEPQGRADFRLRARWDLPGIGPLLLGCLRAMADDYGSLALLRLDGVDDGCESLHVQLLDQAFAEGRSFCLSGADA